MVPAWLLILGLCGNILAALHAFGQGWPACLLFAAGAGINIRNLAELIPSGGRTSDPSTSPERHDND